PASRVRPAGAPSAPRAVRPRWVRHATGRRGAPRGGARQRDGGDSLHWDQRPARRAGTTRPVAAAYEDGHPAAPVDRAWRGGGTRPRDLALARRGTSHPAAGPPLRGAARDAGAADWSGAARGGEGSVGRRKEVGLDAEGHEDNPAERHERIPHA